MNNDYRLALTRARPLLERLTAWQKKKTVSENLLDDPLALESICNLGYHFLRVSIFKSIIAQFENSFVTSPYMNQEYQEAQKFVRTGLFTASTSSASFLRNLKQEEFHIFWPSWSQRAFCSFGFICVSMAMSSHMAQEASEWFRVLNVIRKQLRLKAGFLPILQLGILRIDSIFWRGPKQVLAMSQHVEQGFDEVYGLAGP